MFDPASISGALTSAKVILDLLKNANDAQLAMKISSEVANLQSKLIDVQQQTLALQTENYDLSMELRKMKETVEKERSFTFMHGVYWHCHSVAVPDQEYEAARGVERTELRWEGPFCPQCKDVDGKAVRLKDDGSFQNSPDRAWFCEVHKSDYRAPTMKPQST